MEDSVKQKIEQCAKESNAGNVSFGAVVGALIEAGVESYYADYRRPATTYYTPEGASHTITLHPSHHAVPAKFDAPALQAAIRGAQRGEVRYPEFMELSMAAGCVGYIVWIAGRHVSYFGHRGEVHIEPFPN